MKPINEITADIIDAAIQIHRQFGPGMYEKAYEMLLQIELFARGHAVVREKPVDVAYRGVTVRGAFAIDLLVDDQVVVELKSCEKNLPVFGKQLKTYLVLFGRPVGLLINFGLPALKDGIERVVNHYEEVRR